MDEILSLSFILEIDNEELSISNEEIKGNDNVSLSNSIKTTTVLEEENILFPKGEQHYKLYFRNK